ncbi:MAG: AbrB/MazE/SpoVT family DNA-binding domain-containing protein [bacterium]
MKSMVTQKGQTVIPSDLRKKYGIDVGTEIEWIDTGKGIKMIPIPKDVIKTLRGSAKGENLTRELLSERKKDKDLEK